MLQVQELKKELLSPDFLERWNRKPPSEVRDLLGEEAALTVGYDQQNPHHCYTLFEHMLRTADGVRELTENEEPEERFLLLAAALYHDVGKPAVASWKDFRMVYHGHAPRSAELARPRLEQIGFSRPQTERICFYIARHDDFLPWAMPGGPNYRGGPEVTAENLRRYICGAEQNENACRDAEVLNRWRQLLLLCVADIGAQAEQVIWKGVLSDTREHKQQKIYALLDALEQVKKESR